MRELRRYKMHSPLLELCVRAICLVHSKHVLKLTGFAKSLPKASLLASLIAASSASATLHIESVACPDAPLEAQIACVLKTRGTVQPGETLIFENVFGAYSLSFQGKELGNSTVFGIHTESYFLPKLFDLTPIQGASDPVFEVNCRPVAADLGVPIGLSATSSNIRFDSADAARYALFKAILIRVLLLLSIAALAVYSFPLWDYRYPEFAKPIEKFAPRLFYLCGLFFCLSMTRVPRFFAPVLMSLHVFYLTHSIAEYFFLWSAGIMLLLFRVGPRTALVGKALKLNHFALVIVLGLKLLVLNPKNPRLAHAYCVMVQSTVLLLLSTIRLATSGIKLVSLNNTSRAFIYVLAVACAMLAFEIYQQTYIDMAVTVYCPALFAAAIGMAGLDIRATHASELKEAHALKASATELTYKVAHDIRSPLTALKVLSSSLPTIPPEQKSLINMTIRRMEDISGSLLKTRGINSAKVQDDAKLISLSSCIQEVVDEARVTSVRRGVFIEFLQLSELDTVRISMEKTALQRCLANLISNAVDSLSQGGRVSLISRVAGDEIEIAVQDEGVGIPREKLKDLGRPFNTFNKQNGTGIGFWQVKSDIEAAHGSIEVLSEEGVGTTVLLRIPIRT